ncbi:MAG: UDP-3-O-(3-hydroxymyristoyl)glucosamine N-acyltransferase, partial [Candidatus Zixiibacteriota bacterium]
RIGPLWHIKKDTRIGQNCQIISSVFIGKNVTLGDNCLIYPGVRIMNDTIIGNNVIIHAATVLGSDGFGFAESDKGLKKIKQVGWVEIGDNIEIGSNCSIDRGTLGPTKIGSGTKIDNLVHIAHNVIIGNNCIIVAQVGISGSTTIGNNVVMGGQAGIVGHIEIGDNVHIAGKSGVTKSIKTGQTVLGFPARDIMKSKRIEGALTRLPDLLKRVKNLETEQPE